MAETKKFQIWMKIEVARRLGQLESIEEAVDRAMAEHNLKLEYIKNK